MRHTKILLEEQCPLCRNVFANVYLKRRHMGAVHGMDKDCRPISVERREYLRLQSARKYVRNRHRNTDNGSPTTLSTSQQPSLDCTTVNKEGNFERVDDATPDYHMGSYGRSDAEIEDTLFRRMIDQTKNAVKHVCKPKQKNNIRPAHAKALRWCSY